MKLVKYDSFISPVTCTFTLDLVLITLLILEIQILSGQQLCVCLTTHRLLQVIFFFSWLPHMPVHFNGRDIFFFEKQRERYLMCSPKTVYTMVGRQSEELWSSRGSCLAHKILIVVGLVGVAPTTQLVPFFFLWIRVCVWVVVASSCGGYATTFGARLFRPLSFMMSLPNVLLIAAHKSSFICIIYA